MKYIILFAIAALITNFNYLILTNDDYIVSLIYDESTSRLFAIHAQLPYRVEVYNGATLDNIATLNLPNGTYPVDAGFIQGAGRKIAVACVIDPYPERIPEPQEANIFLIDPTTYSTQHITFNYNSYMCDYVLYNPSYDCLYCSLSKSYVVDYSDDYVIVKYDITGQQVVTSEPYVGLDNISYNIAESRIYHANGYPIIPLVEFNGKLVENTETSTGVLSIYYDAGYRFQTSSIELEAPPNYAISDPSLPVNYVFAYKEDYEIMEMYFYIVSNEVASLIFTLENNYVINACFYENKIYAVLFCSEVQPWGNRYSNDILVIDLNCNEYDYIEDICPTGVTRIAVGDNRIYVLESEGYKLHAIDL